MFMVVVMLHIYFVLHCLYSVGNKITTTTVSLNEPLNSRFVGDLRCHRLCDVTVMGVIPMLTPRRTYGTAIEIYC